MKLQTKCFQNEITNTASSTPGCRLSSDLSPNPGARLSRRLFLPPHIYFCVNEDGGIFLDAAQNKYFGIDRMHAGKLELMLSEASCPSEGGICCINAQQTEIAEPLESKGLLTRDIRVGKPFSPPALKPVDIRLSVSVHELNPRISPSHIVNFVIAYFQAALMLKFLTLATIIRNLAHVDTHCHNQVQQDSALEVRALSSIFCRLRSLILSSKDRCLLLGLAQYIFLRRHRHHPKLVIGVATRPFRAHCWLQHHAVALDGRPHRLKHFTPILVV